MTPNTRSPGGTETLTPEQLNHFDTFGFIVWRQAFSPDEIADISARFEDVLAEDRQGQNFSGDKRQGVHGFLELRPELQRLLEDDRIYTSVEQLLGPGFVWIGSDGNLYVGDTRWHPDNSAAYRRVKVAFYLDPVKAETGCLRVIPGSHLPGMGDRLRELWPIDETGESPYGVAGSDIPFFPLESLPGDVVFFNQRVFHSAYGGRTGVACSRSTSGPSPTARLITTTCEGLTRATSKTNTKWATRSATGSTPTSFCTRARGGSSPWWASWSNWVSVKPNEPAGSCPALRALGDDPARRRRSISFRIKTLDSLARSSQARRILS